jgi:hypothetical protein
VGPTALARSVCDADDGSGGAEGSPPRAEPAWRVAAAYGWLSSELRFGDVTAPFVQRSVAASATLRLDRAWSITAGAGAVVSGFVDAGGVSFAMEPGWLVRLGATWLPLDGTGPWPFVAVSASLAASGVGTTAPGLPRTYLTSLDAGLSVSAGKSIAGIVAPYLGAKVFGGPVFWSLDGASTTGTDVNHWQVAFGAAASLPLGIDVLVEWAPFGARSAVAQAGFAF